jgi:hypothetical protein
MPAHYNSAARRLKRVTAHWPNSLRPTRPPATCLSRAHCARLRSRPRRLCRPAATVHRPSITPHALPPRACLYPLHLPLDEAKKLFSSSFPCSPSSTSLCAREAVTTLCCAGRAASGTGCRRRRAATPRLMSRRSSWPCATEPPPRVVPKVNRAPSSSTFEAASSVPATTGHKISSAPHRRASPDRWTPRRRRHPRPHFCPIGTVSPPVDRGATKAHW